jgi:hypothetical protein
MVFSMNNHVGHPNAICEASRLPVASPPMIASKLPPVVTPAQIRAARGLLRITGQELADAAQMNVSTVRRFEDEETKGSPLGQRALKAALEAMGIEFIGLRGIQLKDEGT